MCSLDLGRPSTHPVDRGLRIAYRRLRHADFALENVLLNPPGEGLLDCSRHPLSSVSQADELFEEVRENARKPWKGQITLKSRTRSLPDYRPDNHSMRVHYASAIGRQIVGGATQRANNAQTKRPCEFTYDALGNIPSLIVIIIPIRGSQKSCHFHDPPMGTSFYRKSQWYVVRYVGC